MCSDELDRESRAVDVVLMAYGWGFGLRGDSCRVGDLSRKGEPGGGGVAVAALMSMVDGRCAEFGEILEVRSVYHNGFSARKSRSTLSLT